MKKILLALALSITALLAGVLATAESSTTLLVYMCGTNLQAAACLDMYEMAEARTSDDINIVVLAGGAKAWDDSDLTGGTRNLVTISDGYFTSVEDVGQVSMGSADSLLAFLEYGMTEYPADRTVVVLWDHGSGSEGGICFDETFNDDGLTLTEINEVLYQLDEDLPDYHIDLFGCDACMMATYELANILSHYNIDCFVASEEVEPGLGWFYTPWLKALDSDPGMSNEALCNLIIDSFMEDGLSYDPDDTLTLSAIDLSKVQALSQSMEHFTTYMAAAIEGGEIAALRRGRSRIYTFGSFCNGSWDMVDMGAVLKAYSSFSPESAAEAERLLGEAVIRTAQTENLQPCSGLSMLIPQDTCESFDYYREGYDISFYLPNWVSFVNDYADLMNNGSYSFSNIVPDHILTGTTISGVSSSNGPIDTISGAPSSQGPVDTINGAGEDYTVTDVDYGFSVQLTPTDLENLDYVEGMLLMDISDDEIEGYVDLGLMQNNRINWQSGEVYSLFDGSWPSLDGQPVPLYDQNVTEFSRRSLIPVKLNGASPSLVVVFSSGSDEGRIIGANAGFDDSGFPIREVTKLKEGDSIFPVYTLYYGEPDSDEDYQESEYLGDEITWRDGMKVVNYRLDEEEPEDDEEPLLMHFCFVLNDIFGDNEISDIISFEL